MEIEAEQRVGEGSKNKKFIALIVPEDYYSRLFSCFSKRKKLKKITL